MNIFAYLLLQIINGEKWKPQFGQSKNYKNWIAKLDYKLCRVCKKLHGKIWGIHQKPEIEPEVHDRCRCQIKVMVTVKSGTATTEGLNGVDWTLKHQSNLPKYYIQYHEAEKLGFKSYLGNLRRVAPNRMITKGVYKNRNGHLPNENGRVWYEADINYKGGFRNGQRIIYSNDGQLFATYDHYQTFFEIV